MIFKFLTSSTVAGLAGQPGLAFMLINLILLTKFLVYNALVIFWQVADLTGQVSQSVTWSNQCRQERRIKNTNHWHYITLTLMCTFEKVHIVTNFWASSRLHFVGRFWVDSFNNSTNLNVEDSHWVEPLEINTLSYDDSYQRKIWYLNKKIIIIYQVFSIKYWEHRKKFGYVWRCKLFRTDWSSGQKIAGM